MDQYFNFCFNNIYQIYCGLLDTTSHRSNSQNVVTTIVDVIPPGTFFGQDSLNETDKLYTYNVISDSFSELYFAYNAEFLPLLNEYSYYSENIFKIENILKQEIKEYRYLYYPIIYQRSCIKRNIKAKQCNN